MFKAVIKSPVFFAASRFGQHRQQRKHENRLWILMYHRILPVSDSRFASEEPGMVVTPDTFAMHLALVNSLFTVVDLADWVEKKQRGEVLPDKACAITFDDGWADNVEYALPILEKTNTPATIFVVPEMIGTQRKFWPNRLGELIAQAGAEWRSLPAFSWLSVCLSNEGFNRPFANSAEDIAVVIDICKSLPDSELDLKIGESERMLQTKASAKTDMIPDIINDAEFKRLFEHPLIAIGSHTCNHFRLNRSLAPEIVEREICDSRVQLENRTGQAVPLFCYPNGDYTPFAKEKVAANYQAAVTTQRGINTANSPLHELKRVAVNEGGSDSQNKFEALLSGWFD